MAPVAQPVGTAAHAGPAPGVGGQQRGDPLPVRHRQATADDRIVTDSNSQIPPELAATLGIVVVPLTVTVDGVDYREGVDIDADDFYARFETGTPAVSTSQPSPGAFAAAYQSLADGGADAIVSVHIGSSISGTVNSARLAAAGSPVPVRIVDTGSASFAIAFSAWEAAEAAAAGATLDDVVAAAERVSGLVGNVFVVGALDLARAGGRLAADVDARRPAGATIPVLTLAGGAMRTVGHAADLDQAATIMADHVRAGGTSLRVGISVADTGTLPLVEALEARLRDAPEVLELIRYRVGPSVGAHTGPGTAGAMFYPSANCRRPLTTGGAQPEEVEAVGAGVEPGPAADVDRGGVEGALQVGELEVGHDAAAGADQVVVVLGQPLVELEAGEALGELEPDEDPGRHQVADDPVERRERHVGPDHLVDLRHRQRRRRPGDGGHHLAPATRPPLAGARQPEADLLVQTRVELDHRHQRPMVGGHVDQARYGTGPRRSCPAAR